MNGRGAPPLVARAALLFVLSLLVVLPAWQGPFLFDDLSAIVDNPAVHDLHAVPRMLCFWEPSAVSYRPARYLSFAVDWALGGGSPVVFHATNAVLHGLNVLLLWRLLLAVAFPPGAALAAALLFAVHPIQSEAVAYISGRKDLLCTLFYLLALHASWRGGRARGWRRGALGALFYLAGLVSFLAKEMALTLPAAVLLVDLARDGRAGGVEPARPDDSRQVAPARAWRALRAAVTARPLFYALLALLGAVAVALKVFLEPATKAPFAPADLAHNVPLALRTVAWHARKTVWPWPHAADLRGLFPQRTGPAEGWSAFWNGGGTGATAIGLGLAMLLVIVAARARASVRRWAVGGGLFFAFALLPVLNLVPLNEPAAERYLYLPLAGLAAAVGAMAGPYLGAGVRGARRAAAGVAVIAVALLAALFAARSAVWADGGRFWADVVRVNPASDRAHNNLALVLLEAGQRTAARRELGLALALGRPPAAQTVANLAALAREDGDLELALGELDSGLDAHPDDPLLLSLRGGILLQSDRPDEALRDLERVAAVPGGAEAATRNWARDRGVAHLLLGDAEGAVTVLEPASRAAPDNASVWTNLGVALLQSERPAEAARALAAATALPDAPAVAWRNLAVALLRLERPAEAAAALEEARRRGANIPPDLADAVARAAGAARP